LAFLGSTVLIAAIAWYVGGRPESYGYVQRDRFWRIVFLVSVGIAGLYFIVAASIGGAKAEELPTRSPRAVTDVVATLKARVVELEAELGQAEELSRGHRADFERERERADHMATIQDRLIAELENLRALLEAAQQSVRPVTLRTWREMTWRERIRWLRTTG
jgi:MFS family permease